VGDDIKLIMIRSGSAGDSEYTITIEKVNLDKDDNVSGYEVLSSIPMSNGDYETMANAIKEYVQHGGDLEYIKNII
jgi:hypothetical protein